MQRREYYVYITTNKHNNVLYTGVTSDISRRVYEHSNGNGSGFTKKYKVAKLVYFEIFKNSNEAIKREKQIKAGSRNKKIKLINSQNPDWRDFGLNLC